MRRLAGTVAALALLLAACGDDGMSASEYRAEAKKVCLDAEKATDAVEQPTRSTPEAIVDYLERLLAANERTTERFEKLDPPDDLQNPHDDLLQANRQGTDAVRPVIEGSTARLRELGQRSNAAAKRLGVPECEQ